MTRRLLLCALLLSLPWGASAQTAITTTTLTNAITTLGGQGNLTLVVASNSGMAVGTTFLYMDGSIYRVQAVTGTTGVTVQNLLFPATHNASVTVYIVPTGAQISIRPVGSCLRGAGTFPQYAPYTLMFNTQDGTVSRCTGTVAGSRLWVTTSPFAIVQSIAPPITP